MRRLIRWLKANNPWALNQRVEQRLDQLQRYGLTDDERRYFVALCKAGRATPPWLMDRLVSYADAAKAAGEERVI
jgi:hypothetical protein